MPVCVCQAETYHVLGAEMLPLMEYMSLIHHKSGQAAPVMQFLLTKTTRVRVKAMLISD